MVQKVIVYPYRKKIKVKNKNGKYRTTKINRTLEPIRHK